MKQPKLDILNSCSSPGLTVLKAIGEYNYLQVSKRNRR